MAIPSTWSTRKTLLLAGQLSARSPLSATALVEVLAERLLERDPAAGRQPGSPSAVDRRREEARRQREIDGDRRRCSGRGAAATASGVGDVDCR